MKKLFLLLIFTNISICFAQKDSSIVFNTSKIFSITYNNFLNKSSFAFTEYSSYKEIYIDTLSKNFLTIERKYTDLNNPLISTKVEKIPLRDISELGYVKGTRENFGLLLGLGVGGALGVILGGLAQRQDNLYGGKPPKSILISALVGIVSGGAIGYFMGGLYNDYQSYELDRYNSDLKRKHDEIQRIIKTGVNYKKK